MAATVATAHDSTQAGSTLDNVRGWFDVQLAAVNDTLQNLELGKTLEDLFYEEVIDYPARDGDSSDEDEPRVRLEIDEDALEEVLSDQRREQQRQRRASTPAGDNIRYARELRVEAAVQPTCCMFL